jgi:hypothetical protein
MAQESAMESWAQEAVCEENMDSIEAVVQRRSCRNDICEAPQQICQVRGHVGEEGTWRCCQHRACVERGHLKVYTMLEGLAEQVTRVHSTNVLNALRCISKVNLVFNLACFQSVPHRSLLAPIYRWPGLEDRVGSDTDYNIDIR